MARRQSQPLQGPVPKDGPTEVAFRRYTAFQFLVLDFIMALSFLIYSCIQAGSILETSMGCNQPMNRGAPTTLAAKHLSLLRDRSSLQCDVDNHMCLATRGSNDPAGVPSSQSSPPKSAADRSSTGQAHGVAVLEYPCQGYAPTKMAYILQHPRLVMHTFLNHAKDQQPVLTISLLTMVAVPAVCTIVFLYLVVLTRSSRSTHQKTNSAISQASQQPSSQDAVSSAVQSPRAPDSTQPGKYASLLKATKADLKTQFSFIPAWLPPARRWVYAASQLALCFAYGFAYDAPLEGSHGKQYVFPSMIPELLLMVSTAVALPEPCLYAAVAASTAAQVTDHKACCLTHKLISSGRRITHLICITLCLSQTAASSIICSDCSADPCSPLLMHLHHHYCAPPPVSSLRKCLSCMYQHHVHHHTITNHEHTTSAVCSPHTPTHAS